MGSIDIYWLPNCSTCKRAKVWLEENGFGIGSFRDLKADPLTRSEVLKLAGKAGGAAELFSKRAIKYRTMKLNQRELSESEMFDLMSGEYTFIKRPVLVAGAKAIAGFSAKRYEAFLNE